MISLASLEKLYDKDKIDEMQKLNKILIEDAYVKILDEDTYYDVMMDILFKHLELFDEFINNCKNEALVNYFIFLKMILDGKLNESKGLMIKLLRDKKFLEDYEDILLYVSIIEEYSLSDLYIPLEEDEELKSYIQVFKRHLLTFNYPMAKEMLKKIRSIKDTLEYQLIDIILDSKKDNIKYILEEDIYPSEVTKKNLKGMERRALCELELGNFIKFNEIINQLDQIYQNQDVMPFKIMIMLLNSIKYLELNKTNVSARSFLTFHGKLEAVLVALLSCKDYYRAYDVIDEEVKNAKEFNIYLAIIYILISKVMLLNERNRTYLDEEIKRSKENLSEMIKKNNYLSCIEGSVIKEKEGAKMESNNIDFYNTYRKKYNEGNYREARINLLRFVKNLRSMGINPYFEHLFKELDYLEKNVKGDNRFVASLIRNSEIAIKKGEYEDALEDLGKWQEGITYFHPRVNALIAKCLYELGKLEDALELYKRCEEYYLYPTHYEDIMMILYKLGKIEEIESYYNLRETTDYASLKITYMMSVIELNKGHYKKARQFLKTIEERCKDIYEVSPNFTYEYEVIKRASGGEDIKYGIDDYIEYGITDDDKDLIELIDEYKRLYQRDYLKMLFITIQNLNESLIDKIEYLLNVIRILKNKHEEVSKDILEYVDYLMSLDELDNLARCRFTVMKKNYQNL